MKKEEFFFNASSGEGKTYACIWKAAKPKAIMQICHGMAEHISRYDEFANYLASAGITVCGIDDPGHGRSVENGGTLGYFADSDGWNHVMRDALTLKNKVADGKTPFFLYGHSMGSFMSRTIAGKQGNDFAGFIWSGTAGPNPALAVAIPLAKAQIKKNGARAESPLLNSLSFGAFNGHFKPNRTEFDWLSRDEQHVDLYVADEKCGFCFTAGGFFDFLTALKELQKDSWYQSVPDLPILMYSGANDPVGNFGKGVTAVYERLKKSGHDKITFKLFPEGRHEMHNEINRQEVYLLVCDWILSNS